MRYDIRFGSVDYVSSAGGLGAHVSFPPRGPSPQVPMPECRLYYASYSDLEHDQQAYYRYWRWQYESGTLLDADATYIYLYIYELAWEANSAVELERGWIKLFDDLSTKGTDSVVKQLATWIVHLRLQAGRSVFDEVTAKSNDADLAFDVAIAAGAGPPVEPLLKHTYQMGFDGRARERLKRVFQQIDTRVLVPIAQGARTAKRPQMLFNNIGWVRSHLGQFGPLNVDVRRYGETKKVQEAVVTLLESLNELAGGPPVHRPGRAYQPLFKDQEPTPKLTGPVGELVRDAVASLPNPNTMEGLQWSIERIFDDGALVLLMLVLWLENKPYIEGAIAFASELRIFYERIGARLGFYAKIGTLRSDFWALSNGARAVWRLEPIPEAPGDIKTRVTVARFSKSMQHLLRGSEARGKVIHTLAVRIARRRRSTANEVTAIFAEETGMTPSRIA